MTSNPKPSSSLLNAPHESIFVAQEFPISTSSSSSDDHDTEPVDKISEIELERAHMKDVPIVNMRLHRNFLRRRK